MELGLEGKVAVVTGSSRGLGLASATALVSEGVRVCVCARGRERLDEAVSELRTIAGAEEVVVGVVADLSTVDGVTSVIDQTVDTFGGLDILVNNVGGMTPGTLESLTDEQWREIMDRNLMAYVWATKFAVEHLGEGAAILNV